MLSIEREYLQLIPNLPNHHKDPFDRLLITTALAENMTLITIDNNIQKYDVAWLWQSNFKIERVVGEAVEFDTKLYTIKGII